MPDFAQADTPEAPAKNDNFKEALHRGRLLKPFRLSRSNGAKPNPGSPLHGWKAASHGPRRI